MKIKGTNALATIGQLYRIFNSRQKRAFAWLIFFTFISSITDLLGLSMIIPIVGLVLSDEFYNTVVSNLPFLEGYSKKHLLLIAGTTFFVVIVAKNAFGLYINKKQVNFVRSLYVSSSMNVLHKVYDRSLLDLQKDTSNELVNKLTNLQIALCSNAAISTIIIINEAIVFALTAIIVCAWNWQLFLLLIGVLVPVMGLFYKKVKNMIREAGLEKSKQSINLYASAQEMIFGYTDIKIAGTEKSFKKRFENIAKKYSVYQGRMDFMLFIPTRIIEVAIFVCIIMIMIYSVYVLQDLEKIVTTISLFSVIAYRSIPSVNRFVIAINNLNSTEFIFNDEDFFLDESHEKEPVDIAPMPFNSTIDFSHVSYMYPGDNKFVIKDCDLTIRKGEKIGVIGKSGSGKSTLINNILGFIQPTEGEILIDGIPLSRSNIKNWWKVLGYVRQEVFIMNAPLLENIAIGEDPETVDRERVMRAVKLASLEELVNNWPEGLDTMLSERGNNLSGGQRQRISIARAIYKGAQVLIFDEATSALDTKTEEEITNSIRELGKEELTIIIIAHRYSSLKYCDKIYQMENGRVKDTLTYSQLELQNK